MNRWRRWRPRKPAGRAGARRAGVTALAVLLVTAALAVALAVRYHLAWPPVVVAILGTLPALYLAWLAVLGVISPPEPVAVEKPAFGRRVDRWHPLELGVHQVIGAGPLPAYIGRPHDELLRAVLDPAVPASRLVVVRGGSSTGKTRAAYEAVTARLACWQLDYPLNPAALKERLEAAVPARTVLWLGELRQYADAEGGAAVLAGVADLLTGEGHLVITTMWPEQWTAYTAAARAGPGAADPAGTAGRLLGRLPELTGDPAGIDPARGGVIDVPDQFAAADLAASAATGDPVLAEAAAAAAGAGHGGQVTQYLAGVPDLLDRYAGPGGDPYGQAVITAAMDATRLGHASPLPAALLQDAAVGYLTSPQRTKPIITWRDTALAWAAEELRGAVRALQPVPPPDGTGVAGYQVADYLDQHGRRTRGDQLGPASLWDALTAHTATARDLDRLGQAARDRGLYRHAAALWTTAATLGSTDASWRLINLLRQLSRGDAPRAAQWAAGHASLDSPGAVAWLLEALGETGASDAVTTLLARNPAAQVGLDSPGAVAVLLRALGGAGAGDAVTTLLARNPAAQVGLDSPGAVASLVRALGQAGASDAVTVLAARSAAQVSLDNSEAVAWLLQQLHEAGVSDAARALADRAAGQVSLDDPGAVSTLLWSLRQAGASDAVTALAARSAAHASLDNPLAVAGLLRELRKAGAEDRWDDMADWAAAQASLDNPQAVAMLLQALREAGAGEAVTTLLARDPAAHASLNNPQAVAMLLQALRQVGAGEAVTTLLARDPAAHANLDNPLRVAGLLRELREAGAGEAVTTLLARDPASHASLDNPGGVARLLQALGKAGAGDAARALAVRAAAHASLDNPLAVADLLEALGEAGAGDAARALAARAANAGMFERFLKVYPGGAASYPSGREPDGAPSHTWTWQEPANQHRGSRKRQPDA